MTSSSDAEPRQGAYRRLAVDCIGKVIAALDEPLGRDVAIHTIRKQCKQARALVRLFHDGPPAARREACRLFRDLARSLSAARDARVALAVHDTLLEHYGELLDPVPFARLREQLEHELRRQQAAAGSPRLGGEDLRRRLLAARVQARRAALAGSNDVEALQAALVRAYRRARQSARAAAEFGRAPDFHEARKRAKDYWYQLEFIAQRWPSFVAPRIAVVRRLTELLGDAQDCEVYATAISANPGVGKAPAVELMLALAEHRAQGLRREALNLCPQVYGEKPKALAATIVEPEPIEPRHRAAG